MLKHVGRKD